MNSGNSVAVLISGGWVVPGEMDSQQTLGHKAFLHTVSCDLQRWQGADS